MRVFGLPRRIIRGGAVASRVLGSRRLGAKTPDIEAARRRDAVARWLGARADGLTAEQAARAVGTPLSTLYRWAKQATPRSRRPRTVRPKTWTPALRKAVERLRRDFPMWGRAKLGPLLRAEGFAVSDSTAGRIIASLVARGGVEPAPTLRRRPYARRWTAKRRFARRRPRDLAVNEPGALVQLDTIYVNLTPTKAIKHFTAYDPVAKWTVGKAFNRATAHAAASFLDKILADMPFPVKAIQVDGGAEFMAQFETACQAKGVALYALPPRRPQMNGAVERCNGAWRYEFYETYDLPSGVEELNPILDSFQHLYNHHRPRGALAGQTPANYLANRSASTPHPSQMC